MKFRLNRLNAQSAIEAPPTLANVLRSHILQNPSSRYIEVDQAGRQIAEKVSELHRRSVAILPRLHGYALANQSDIVLCFESVLDFIPAAWACIAGRISFLPWHFKKLCSEGEIASRLEVIDRKLDDPVLVTTERIVTRNPSLRTAFKDIVTIDRQRTQPLDAEEEPARRGSLLILTSGTTGGPKVAVINHDSLLSRYLSRRPQARGQHRIVCFPFDSVTGLWTIFPGSADTIFIQPERLAAKPLELLNVVHDCRIAAVSLSTSMAARISEAASKELCFYDLSSLARVGFGSEMIVPSVVMKFVRQLQQMGACELKVSFGYGMTETGAICWTRPMTADEVTEQVPHEYGPVSVGRVAEGWQLRIVDDVGNALPDGTAGNVEVWSETKLFSGYRKDKELTRASFAEDGWFKTGDVGIASAGTLVLTGRLKSTIIINARNILLESIEAPARRLDGVYGALVAAAPVRPSGSTTDDLAFFFVPRAEHNIDQLCRQIKRETAERFGVAIKHLVPLKIDDVPLTPSGKLRRNVLAEMFQLGMLKAHDSRPHNRETDCSLSEAQRWICELWQKLLKLDRFPSLDDNFYELGGDSLSSAELIFAAEEKFSCDLPLEAFFECPTVARMDALLMKHSEPTSLAKVEPCGDNLLHKLQSFSGSWNGQRLFGDSLVVGLNTDGCGPPIFWVFQDYSEAKILAQHLGSKQPLYAMRSCVGIIRPKDYTAAVLETVCNRYLWEILALPVSDSFVLGGNCQGGIVALALARRLKQISRAPSSLVLLEWSYSYGSYDEPVVLIYGEGSYTADMYQHPEQSKIKWQNDFTSSTVCSMPGKHGQFFTDANVPYLGAILHHHADRA